MNIYRIVEHQAASAIRLVTDTQDEYEFIETELDSLRPALKQTSHHLLIKKPFSYPTPVPLDFSRRFTPPGSDLLAFYGSEYLTTAVYELAYHFMEFRIHLPAPSQVSEPRTAFSVEFDPSDGLNLNSHPKIDLIASKKSYEVSQQIAEENKGVPSILYPSCRGPNHELNVAVYDIQKLGTDIEQTQTLKFVYLHKQQSSLIFFEGESNPRHKVAWSEVA